jgi:hypothetical protein
MLREGVMKVVARVAALVGGGAKADEASASVASSRPARARIDADRSVSTGRIFSVVGAVVVRERCQVDIPEGTCFAHCRPISTSGGRGGSMHSESYTIHVDAPAARVHQVISDTYAPSGLPPLGATVKSDAPRQFSLVGGEGNELCIHDWHIRPEGSGSAVDYTMSFPNLPESQRFGAWLGMIFGGKKTLKTQLQQVKAQAERS